MDTLDVKTRGKNIQNIGLETSRFWSNFLRIFKFSDGRFQIRSKTTYSDLHQTLHGYIGCQDTWKKHTKHRIGDIKILVEFFKNFQIFRWEVPDKVKNDILRSSPNFAWIHWMSRHVEKTYKT